MTPAELRQLLQQHILEIAFTKINGETRVMLCTLMPNRLPPRLVVESTEDKKEEKSPTTLSVFCTDINQWRSFRFENLKNWKIVE